MCYDVLPTEIINFYHYWAKEAKNRACTKQLISNVHIQISINVCFVIYIIFRRFFIFWYNCEVIIKQEAIPKERECVVYHVLVKYFRRSFYVEIEDYDA